MLYVHVCREVLTLDALVAGGSYRSGGEGHISDELGKKNIGDLLGLLRRMLACCACGGLLFDPSDGKGSHIVCGSCHGSGQRPRLSVCPCFGDVRQLVTGTSMELLVDCYRHACYILRIHVEKRVAEVDGDGLVDRLIKEADGQVKLTFDDLPPLTMDSLPSIVLPQVLPASSRDTVRAWTGKVQIFRQV